MEKISNRAVRDPELIKAVLERYQAGMIVSEISVAVGRKMATCYWIIREFVQAGAIDGRGRGRSPLDGDDEAIQKLIKMTRYGATIAEIMVAVNRSQSWVTQTRARKRAEGLLPAKKANRIDWPTKLPQVIRMIEAGHSAEGISFAIECSVDTLRKKLRELGIKSNRQKALEKHRNSRGI
jgi:transposase